MEEVRIRVSPERLKPLIFGSCSFKSSDDFSLTEEDRKVAFLELGETEDVRISALKRLKEKINCDPKMRYRTDDDFLLRYLRYSKFDVDNAYNSLRKFYISRQSYPHAFSLSQVEKVLNTRVFIYLPYTDEENCLLLLQDFRNWKIDEWTFWDMLSAFHVIADMVTLNPNVQIHGVKGIWDLRGLSLKHIAHIFNPSTIVFLVKTLQEMYPWRIKKIVAIHSNSLLQATYNAWRYLLKKKIRDRIVFLGSDMTELHKYFNPAVLPKEYGGTLEEKDCHITRHAMENMSYIKYERSFGLL